MTIAVTTPTGHVGRHLVRLLCQAGHRPRLLLRDPARLDDDLRDLVDLAVGDQHDAEYVAAATRDVEAVYWVHPEDWTRPDPDADAERSGAGLAAAVRANAIPNVVFQSSVGAEKRHGAGFLDGLGRIEEQLQAARADTDGALTILRCAYFTSNLLMDLDGLRAGRLTTTLPLERPMAWVDPVDIATVAALRLLDPGRSGERIQAVHGPADLTWPEAARILSAATGTAIGAVRITDDDQRAALRAAGMSETVVAGVVGMSAGLRDGFTPEQPRSAVSTTPGSLGAWAFDTLRPALETLD